MPKEKQIYLLFIEQRSGLNCRIYDEIIYKKRKMFNSLQYAREEQKITQSVSSAGRQQTHI